jgi:hypothetical protein
MKINYLVIAGTLSFIAAGLHIAIIFGGAKWYRFFGAGEQMASMAEQGLLQLTIITVCIGALLAIWGAYAWSAAGVLPTLPLLKTALILITAVYLLRGAVGMIAPFAGNHPQFAHNSTSFWVWSSLICLTIGLVHLKGIWLKWYA